MDPVAALAEPTVLSETQLVAFLRARAPGFDPTRLPRFSEVPAGPAEIEDWVAAWRRALTRLASRLAQRARATLHELAPGCLYPRLDEPEWQRAALVAELFRDSAVSKNAGWLDVRTLQADTVAVLNRGDGLPFTIAWGQPKRGAGGLKTLGPMPDLAELFAIARLAALVRAAGELTGVPARLTVATGGDRFAAALFTRPRLCAEYDRARQRLADVLAGPGTVRFVPYAAARGAGPAPGEPAVPDDVVAAHVERILLNVDWERLLAADPAQRVRAPHGVTLPLSPERWLAGQGDPATLQRAALSCAVDPRYRARWHAELGDDDLLDDAVGFVRAVAWEAARVYLGLQLADRPAPAPGTLALTVHEKRDRPHVPAVATLGIGAGNQLAQHVVPVVEREGLRFATVAELAAEPLAAVLVAPRPAGPPFAFDWLAGTPQPLALVAAGLDPAPALAGALEERG